MTSEVSEVKQKKIRETVHPPAVQRAVLRDGGSNSADNIV